MKPRSKLLTILLLLSFATVTFGEDFDRAHYLKKTEGGKKTDTVSGVLRIVPETKEVQFINGQGAPEFSAKPEQIKSLLYERTAKPRYAAGLLLAWPLLFTKSKSHFLTIQYEGPNGQAQYAIVRLDKNNYRDALASLESQTGRKVERNEEN